MSEDTITTKFDQPEDQNVLDVLNQTIMRGLHVLNGPKAPTDINLNELRRQQSGKPLSRDKPAVKEFSVKSFSLDELINHSYSPPEPENMVSLQAQQSNPVEHVSKFSSSDSSLIAMLTALLSMHMSPDAFNTNPIIKQAYSRLGNQ